MKEVPVFNILYRGEVSLSPPQTRPQPVECKALRSSPYSLPRQPDLTVTPHKAELKQWVVLKAGGMIRQNKDK